MSISISVGLSLLWPVVAFAAGGNDGAEGAAVEADPADIPPATASASTDGDKQARAPRSKDESKWIHRWAPERNMGELGVFGGMYRAGPNHELFEPDPSLPDQGFTDYVGLAAEIGARAGYYPSRFFGFEAEGGVIPTRTTDSERATLWNIRGSVVGQLGLWSVTPFVLAGAGGFGVSSSREAAGNDVDPSVHFGGGVKFYLNRLTQIRLDVRDVVGHQQGVDNAFRNHSIEALLGLSVTLGRAKKAPAEPVDTDGDGFYDPQDSCVNEVGVEPDGCPIRDTDGDGFLDPSDACVADPGVAPDGCPVLDTDGDGFMDPDDQCVDTAGVEPDGCPILDTDGDGLLDPDDQCVEQPESVNGFEDGDGCPDELPAAVKDFSGVMEGIRFKTGKATILPRSYARLKQAAKVMADFPEIRVEISGHTDSVGKRDYNVDLSQRRADSVREFLMSKGIAAERLQTRGAGPDEPIANNDSKDGRAKNRRIEFKVLTDNAK